MEETREHLAFPCGKVTFAEVPISRPEAPVARSWVKSTALQDAMREDDRVFLLGEDIGTLGGVYRVTDGLIAGSNLVLVASRRQRDEVLARVPSTLRMTFTMREAGRIAAGLPDGDRPEVARDLVDTVARMADHRGDHVDAAADDVIDPQGRDLAAPLGRNTCALMRGHGAVVATSTLKEAVIAAIYLKVNAEVQLQAMAIGTPRRLSDAEVEKSRETQFSPLALDRAWEYFCARAGVDPS